MSAKFQAIYAHAKAEQEKRDNAKIRSTKQEIINLAMYGRVHDAETEVVEIFPESEGLKGAAIRYQALLKEAFKEDGIAFQIFRKTEICEFSITLAEL